MPAFESKYSWGGMKYSVSPDVVGKVLEEIEESDGVISREAFLDRSRDEDSPTHSLFEWNDSLAGEKWRLNQARNIISSLRLNVVNMPSEPSELKLDIKVVQQTPAFISITDRSKSDIRATAIYKNASYVLGNSDTRVIAISNAMRLLQIFKERYSVYTEFSKVIDAINELEERATK